MANATAITINDLVPNGELADPTPDVLDTGSDPVTLSCALGGQTDRTIIRVKNGAAEALGVAVLAGDNPPAQRAGLGAYETTLAQNEVAFLGPFESGRFGHDDGDLELLFTPGGTIDAEITALRLPQV